MVKLKLKSPVKWGQELIEELEVREPKAKDIRHLSGAPSVDDLLVLAGKLTGQVKSMIDELSVPDAMALLEIVGNFMDAGQKTGSQD